MLHSDFSLLQYNTFGIDEQAKFFFSFSDKQELAAFLKNEFRKDLHRRNKYFEDYAEGLVTEDEVNKIVKELEIKKTEFYTYKPKIERGFKIILRGMHPSIDTEGSVVYLITPTVE